MNSEMMAKLRGLIEEAATGKCNITAEGKSCPVHGMEECDGYMEEDIKPAGISDELAAKKIAAKIAGTPGLNMPKIKQYVTKYLGMVGKAPTDVAHLAALVSTELENKGVMESNAKPDFLDLNKNGNKKEPMAKAAKDAKSGKKSTAKKGGMSAKQAKYFGKKTVKESREFSPELLALMQKYGVMDNAGEVDEMFFFPKDKSPAGQRDANKSQDKLSARNPGDVAKYGDDYKYMRTGKSQDAQRMRSMYAAGGPKTALPEDEASDQQALAKLIQDIRNGPAPDPNAVMARIRELLGVNERPAPARPPAAPGTLKHYLDNPDIDTTGTEHHDMLNLMKQHGLREDEEDDFKDETQFGKPSSKHSGPWRWRTDPDALHDKLSDLPPHIVAPQGGARQNRRKYDSDYYDYGMNSNRGRDRDIDFDEDIHIDVNGAEAQDMISRLMTLAGQDTAPMSYDHADTCDGCGCASSECTCDGISTGYSGPVDLSMEENIDHDFGHTAHSDMGEPVDPDTYTYKAPVGNQRMVKGIMGDNPLIKEDATALGAKLKKDYKRYVAEAELARSNAGDASPLTANSRDQFDMDPFAGETPVTDGSHSPLSTVKRQKINK